MSFRAVKLHPTIISLAYRGLELAYSLHRPQKASQTVGKFVGSLWQEQKAWKSGFGLDVLAPSASHLFRSSVRLSVRPSVCSFVCLSVYLASPKTTSASVLPGAFSIVFRLDANFTLQLERGDLVGAKRPSHAHPIDLVARRHQLDCI